MSDNHVKMRTQLNLLLLLTLTTGGLAASDTDPPSRSASLISEPPSALVGLRRSSYGLRAQNTNHDWWAGRAKQFVAHFPGATPTIIQIVSTYQNDGTTQFEFLRPAGDAGDTTGMKFARGPLDHEAALTEYDRAGVRAILQVESGHADLSRCLEVMHRQFGQHPCVAGFGVDAEWFFCKESPKKEGRPITDAEAKAWTEKALALNPNYTLFLKHWAKDHMPPVYRHPRLWFLSDSQRFKSAEALLADFQDWAGGFPGAVTGYQFGYKADHRWWSKLVQPPVALGRQIQKDILSARHLFWVDFTADQMDFSNRER